MPYVLRSLLGKGATTGLLVLIFMAITSTVSSSLIAVSSIISFDFYRTYFNPRATDRQTLKVSHLGVIFHGAFMAGFSLMLNYIGANATWTTYFRPIVACPAIFPLMLTILWSGQTKAAAILSPILGLLCGLTTWLSLSWYWSGAITITTTMDQLPSLYACIVSFFSPLLFSVVISYMRPERFDWRVFLKIDLIEDKSPAGSTLPSSTASSIAVGEIINADTIDTEKKQPHLTTVPAVPAGQDPAIAHHNNQADLDNVVHPFSPQTIALIHKWLKIATVFLVTNILVTIILWPLPLYRDWIFTKSFFSGWVTVAIIWLFAAFGVVVVFPVYDGRHAITKTVRGMLKELKRS